MSMIVYETATEEKLISWAKDGQKAALDELYRRNRDRIWKYAYNFLGDDGAAWDVVQETFLFFVKSIDHYRYEARLSTFLFRVARSICLNRKRDDKRLVLTENVEGGDFVAPASGKLNDEQKKMYRAMLQLNHEQREVIILRMLDDLSTKEVAEILEVPEGTVKSRLHNALDALRKLMGAA